MTQECKGCPKEEWKVWKWVISVMVASILTSGYYWNNYGRASEAEKTNMLQEQRLVIIEKVMEKLPDSLEKINSSLNVIDKKIDVHIAQGPPRK